MTDKTKAKIETMANKRLEMFWDIKTMNNKQCAEMLADYEDGATPWAEWCERFVEHLEMCDNDADKEWVILYSEKIVDEYHQWLEGDNEPAE